MVASSAPHPWPQSTRARHLRLAALLEERGAHLSAQAIADEVFGGASKAPGTVLRIVGDAVGSAVLFSRETACIARSVLQEIEAGSGAGALADAATLRVVLAGNPLTAEWFAALRTGDTPDANAIARLLADWIAAALFELHGTEGG